MNTTPIIAEPMEALNPIAPICEVFKERQRIKQRMAELESDARKFEAEMAAAGHQVDVQARLMEKQLEANERQFYAVLDSTGNAMRERAANHAEIRTTIRALCSIINEADGDHEFRVTMTDSLLVMVDKLNQSQSQLEAYHSQAVKSLATDWQPRLGATKAEIKEIS